jgi:HSP20 family molecular chaperone IbpA
MVEKTVPTVQESKEVAPKEGTRAESRYYYPPVDIFESGSKLIVIADIPGTEKEDVHVKVEEGILTVEANVSSQESGDTIYREFQWGNFYRQFEISDEIDSEKITAELKNGVLTLHLPKVEKASKLIEVKVA